jgi:hypothetical protein
MSFNSGKIPFNFDSDYKYILLGPKGYAVGVSEEKDQIGGKKVVTIPVGVPIPEVSSHSILEVTDCSLCRRQWEIKDLGEDGRISISLNGESTVVKNGLVYALAIDEKHAEKWELRFTERANAYK